MSLEGVLTKKTFAGPPNYEDIRKGDKPEPYWLLKLDKAICVDQSTVDPELDVARKDIRTIQLVLPPEFYKIKASLVGGRVVVRGTLFGAITGHHHTPVLLTVSNLDAK